MIQYVLHWLSEQYLGYVMTNITYKGVFSPSPLAFVLVSHDDRFLLALFNLYKKQIRCIF